MDGAAPRLSVLLCRADAVDRAILHADLVRLGYDVVAVGDAPTALEMLHRATIVVTDLELPGGGGFSVCRAAAERGSPVTAIGLSLRPVDAELRRIGGECGMAELLEHPASGRQVHAAIELVRARDARRLVPGVDGLVRGDLSVWSLADVTRWVETQKLTARVELRREPHKGTLHCREGAITYAEQASLQGEQAFQRMLLWRTGTFSIRTESEGTVAVRPPRNIHRPSRAVLIDGLAAASERDRLLRELPASPYRVQPLMAGQVDAALAAALDGRRSLAEALEAAGLDDLLGVQLAGSLIRAGALVPAPGPRSGALVRSGATVRRKLDFGSVETEREPTIVEELPPRPPRPSRRAAMAWAAVALSVAAGTLVWYVTR